MLAFVLLELQRELALLLLGVLLDLDHLLVQLVVLPDKLFVLLLERFNLHSTGE